MGSAFKCDRCGELAEGAPNRYKAVRYLTAGPFGWTGSQRIGRAELCDSCAETFEERVSVLLGEVDEVDDDE